MRVFQKEVMNAIRTQVIYQFVYVLTQLILHKTNGDIESKIYLYSFMICGKVRFPHYFSLLSHWVRTGWDDVSFICYFPIKEWKKEKMLLSIAALTCPNLAVETQGQGWTVGGTSVCQSLTFAVSRALTCIYTRDECTPASISSANIFRHLHTHDTTRQYPSDSIPRHVLLIQQ